VAKDYVMCVAHIMNKKYFKNISTKNVYR